VSNNLSSPVECLYVHVPFCLHKCFYCAFFSEIATPANLDRYTEALRREMELVGSDLHPRTIYFGGGTPTLLGLNHWKRILTTLQQLGWQKAIEWTVESNPATLSLPLARALRDMGVNRISLGIQSTDNALLERLGRVHDRQQVFRAYDDLRAANFNRINLDLMFAIPGQTLASWRKTLREVMALGSEHLSCYEVTYEEDTPLYNQLAATKSDEAEDLACAMYEELICASDKAGYQQYEVSNFARHQRHEPAAWPSEACLHNINYWRGGSFYGLGPSATSYVRGERARNYANTDQYCEILTSGRRPIESRESLSPLARAGEIAAFGLRMTCGWPFEDFKAVTGFDLRAEWAGEIAQMLKLGFGERDAVRFKLTPLGLRHADWVAEQFIRLTDS
jgi:oxygen-independent coproporphyrinogen III oxidase